MEVATQQNFFCHSKSDFDLDNERQFKHSNFWGKAPKEYWGETHPILDNFIQQCEENFEIDGCT